MIIEVFLHIILILLQIFTKWMVLDECRELNLEDSNYSNCGEKSDYSILGLEDIHVKQLTKLFLATEVTL